MTKNHKNRLKVIENRLRNMSDTCAAIADECRRMRHEPLPTVEDVQKVYRENKPPRNAINPKPKGQV